MAGRTHMIFSYGTLKRGERNFKYMQQEEKGTSTFQGRGVTVDKYPLVVATEYKIPFLIDDPGQGYNISGEVFEIDEKLLAFLDEFEGHPDFYRRQEISISITTDSEDKPRPQVSTQKCWTYFVACPDKKKELLAKDWISVFSDPTQYREVTGPIEGRDEIKNELLGTN